jgi:hypothetical protein
LDHFKISLEKDTVAFTELSKIFIQAKDANDVDIDLDTTKVMALSVMTNEEYATFIEKDGDTLKTSPVRLGNVSYGDLKGGFIRVAAVKKDPDSLVVCRIRAELANEANKKGDTTIVVVEQTLKIVMGQPYEVRPSIPTEDTDTARVRQRKKGFEIKMTRGGKPVVNHPFQLSTIYVDSTGGHDHDSTRTVRRLSNDDNYGYFLVGQATQHRRPLDGLTNADGKFEVSYHASIFGDTMRIRVTSRTNRLLTDSISIAEKATELVLLAESANYTKIGGTPNHHGPPLHTAREDDHNHFGTQQVNRHLEDIASAYHSAYPLLPRLAINDISLPSGGKFDVNGNWTGDHDFHRNGLDADVRSFTMPGDRFHDQDHNDEYNPEGADVLLVDNNGNGQYDGDVAERFRRIALQNQVQRAYLENPNGEGGRPEHWHLFFWDYRNTNR